MRQAPKCPIVVFGTGDIGEVAHYYFAHNNAQEVVAFTVDASHLKQKEFAGLPVVAFEEVQDRYPPSRYGMYVAIGYRNLNKVRAGKYHEAKAKGYSLATYVDAHSCVAEDAKIGDNCFIYENQTIQPFVEIGNNVIMWSGNHIGHHTVIGDHCFIASHVVISGHVTVQQHCFLGVNATIRNHITIAPETVVGAGAVILRDTDPKGVYVAQESKKHALDSSQLKGI